MEASSSALFRRQTTTTTKERKKTRMEALGNDVLSIIFTFLNITQLIRCSAVCKSWSVIIEKLKLLQIQFHKQERDDSGKQMGESSSTDTISKRLEQIAMNQHKLSLEEGPINVFQWKGHSNGVHQCRMKMGLVLTGVGDKMMRLWSAESYKCLDEYPLPDKAPLTDFDFDEGKVVGLLGSRICIWRRTGTKDIFSSREGMFTKGLCMRYIDPHAVVGCEDGRARVFDMYSRKCSQIIKMHGAPVTCLTFVDDQLVASGSSRGNVSVTDLSTGQQVAIMRSRNLADIRTLCFHHSSNLLFAASASGHVSCLDLRKLGSLWETRVSSNVIYSMSHLQNDSSLLVTGGIDGVLRTVDQNNGEVTSRCIMDESKAVTYSSMDKYGVIEKRKGRRLPEDSRLDLMPKTSRPMITCLAVGMQKVVTTHNEKYIRVWRFGNEKQY